MKRSIQKRAYTPEYREAVVRQVIDAGCGLAEVARSLEMSHKTLANWVRLARAQKPLVKREPAVALDAAALELSRLRAENARLKMDNAILKENGGVFREGVAMKYAWIESHRDSFVSARCARCWGYPAVAGMPGVAVRPHHAARTMRLWCRNCVPALAVIVANTVVPGSPPICARPALRSITSACIG